MPFEPPTLPPSLSLSFFLPPMFARRFSSSSPPSPLFRIRFIELLAGTCIGGISSFPFDTRILLAIGHRWVKPNSPERFEWSTTRVISNRLEFTFGMRQESRPIARGGYLPPGCNRKRLYRFSLENSSSPFPITSPFGKSSFPL